MNVALVAGSRLTLFHVSPDTKAEWSDFPGVRRTLASVLRYLDTQPTDLVVLASHRHDDGLAWLRKSVAAPGRAQG